MSSDAVRSVIPEDVLRNLDERARRERARRRPRDLRQPRIACPICDRHPWAGNPEGSAE